MLGTLLGNFRVVQRLGESGAGVAFIGRHEALGHRAVVKLLRAELSSNRTMIQRMFREAEAATAIRNRGIAQVLDFGVASDGRAYIVTELLEGESLAARLEHGRRDAADACRLGRQVAGVLHAAHAAGIIHRDLKPDSLFLVADPEVVGGECIKVLDFGIGKLVGDVRAAGAKTIANLGLGTPAYMAPEQCRSAGAADVRSDIYSLGCILFELTCGHAPFASSNLGDIVAAHLHDPPPHPLSVVPDLPPRLAALILRMLAKHPDARPQTMETVSHALGEILQALDAAPARAAAPAAPVAAPSASGAPVAAPSASEAPAAPARPSPSPASVGSPPARPSPTPAGLSSVTPPVGLPTVATPTPTPTSPTPSTEPASARRGRGTLATSASLSPSSSASSVIEPTRVTRRRRPGPRRMLFMAGSIVCAGIAGAFVLVLAAGHSSSAGQPASNHDIAAARVVEPGRDPSIAAPRAAPGAPEPPPESPVDPAPKPGAGATTLKPIASDAAPGAGAADTARPPAQLDTAGTSAQTAAAADRIARDCSGHLLTRHWPSLAQCADRLQPLDAARAAELRARATEELRSAPHSAGVTAALRDRNLKQAKIELDQVWSGSVELAALRHTYELAESREIDALATELDRVRDTTCNAFNERLAAVRTRSPVHVLAEVTHRVHCVPTPSPQSQQPPPGCDADALASEGGRQFSAGHLAESLASYEAAYACQPAGMLLQKQLVVACNLQDEPRARALWKRLSEPQRTPPLLAICIRNGLNEAILSAH